MGHGAAQRSLGICDDDDSDDDDDDDDKGLCQKWRVKLIFRGTYRLSRTWIVECLKIIDVGCNLKQFDVEACSGRHSPRVYRLLPVFHREVIVVFSMRLGCACMRAAGCTTSRWLNVDCSVRSSVFECLPVTADVLLLLSCSMYVVVCA